MSSEEIHREEATRTILDRCQGVPYLNYTRPAAMAEQEAWIVHMERLASATRAILAHDEEGKGEPFPVITGLTPAELAQEFRSRHEEIRDMPPPTPEEVQNFMDPDWVQKAGQDAVRQNDIPGLKALIEKSANVILHLMSRYGSCLTPADDETERTKRLQNPDQDLRVGGPSLIQPGRTNPGADGANPDAAGTNHEAAGFALDPIDSPALPSLTTARKTASPAAAGTNLGAAGTNPALARTKPAAAAANPAAAGRNIGAAPTNPAAAGTNPKASDTNTTIPRTKPAAANANPAAAGTNPAAAHANPAAAGTNPAAARANPTAAGTNPAAASDPTRRQQRPCNPNTAAEQSGVTLASQSNGPRQAAHPSRQGPGSPGVSTSAAPGARKVWACARCAVTEERLENGKLRKCGGCRSVRYCGKACQNADWPAHKATCKRLQA